MRRGDFENLLRGALDSDLNPRGFHLTPQAPADFIDDTPWAVYEADPNEYGERYPRLDSRDTGNTICVDLRFHLNRSTGRITSDLDGTSLDDIATQFGLPLLNEHSPEPLDEQLKRLSSQIVAILAAAEKKIA
jgi:hypothetical protein